MRKYLIVRSVSPVKTSLKPFTVIVQRNPLKNSIFHREPPMSHVHRGENPMLTNSLIME